MEIVGMVGLGHAGSRRQRFRGLVALDDDDLGHVVGEHAGEGEPGNAPADDNRPAECGRMQFLIRA
jgi:hypothetical protein